MGGIAGLRSLRQLDGVQRVASDLDLIDGPIVCRTAPGSKVSAGAAGAVVALEVDD